MVHRALPSSLHSACRSRSDAAADACSTSTTSLAPPARCTGLRTDADGVRDIADDTGLRRVDDGVADDRVARGCQHTTVTGVH
jgi:hypothetical protein